MLAEAGASHCVWPKEGRWAEPLSKFGDDGKLEVIYLDQKRSGWPLEYKDGREYNKLVDYTSAGVDGSQVVCKVCDQGRRDCM